VCGGRDGGELDVGEHDARAGLDVRREHNRRLLSPDGGDDVLHWLGLHLGARGVRGG